MWERIKEREKLRKWAKEILLERLMKVMKTRDLIFGTIDRAIEISNIHTRADKQLQSTGSKRKRSGTEEKEKEVRRQRSREVQWEAVPPVTKAELCSADSQKTSINKWKVLLEDRKEERPIRKASISVYYTV